MSKHQILLVATLPGGDAIATVHQGNPDMPQGTIQHLQLKFTSHYAADMIARVIKSEGVKEFVSINFTVEDYVTKYQISEEVLTSEEAIAAVKESTLPTPRKRKERKDSK